MHTEAIQTDAEFYLFHKTAKDREKTVLGKDLQNSFNL